MFSMDKKEDNWTYIRIRKSTAKKLRLLKIEQDFEMYEDVVDALLTKFSLGGK